MPQPQPPALVRAVQDIQRGEALGQPAADGPRHDEAGDEVRRVEDAVALALGTRRVRRLAPDAGADRFQVADGLLEDMAEDVDVQVGVVVVAGQAQHAFQRGVGDVERVQRRVFGEQAAVVAVDLHGRMAPVHRPEQPAQLLPARYRHKARALRRQGRAQHLARQQPGVLAKADEQHPVEEFLRLFQQADGVLGRLGFGGRGIVLAQPVEQVQPGIAEIGVERLGDALFLDMGVFGQLVDRPVRVRRLAQQGLAPQQEQELPQPRLVRQVRHPERLAIALAPVGAVQPQVGVIADDHPAAAVGLHRVAEGLLDGRELAVMPALLAVQIGAGAFQFQHRAGLRLRTRPEPAQPRVRRLVALHLLRGGFRLHEPAGVRAHHLLEAQQPVEEFAEELRLQGAFLVFQQRAGRRAARPIGGDAALFGIGFEGVGAKHFLEQAPIKQRLEVIGRSHGERVRCK